jgi:outer membrane protein assembly factor BamD
VTEAAVEEFEEFVQAYPDAELSQHAKDKISELKEKEAESHFMVARFYEKQRNYKSAKIYYKMIIDDYKNSKFSQKALEKYREMSLKDR